MGKTLECRVKELEQVSSSDQQMEVQAGDKDESAKLITDAQTDIADPAVESRTGETDGKPTEEVKESKDATEEAMDTEAEGNTLPKEPIPETQVENDAAEPLEAETKMGE